MESWAEREILARGEVLAEVTCGVWRYPVGAGFERGFMRSYNESKPATEGWLA